MAICVPAPGVGPPHPLRGNAIANHQLHLFAMKSDSTGGRSHQISGPGPGNMHL